MPVEKSLGFASVYFSPMFVWKSRAQASFPRGIGVFSRHEASTARLVAATVLPDLRPKGPKIRQNDRPEK
ncbi:hypothetical protein [Magnetospirillum moscoviense]|uniref:hypothetical protein n=1 Tax=Magnetospirillum moscoviense TaxID=1437059 RepID=UPI0012E90E55|nr:hypothetical protein [Magnetospirillum moscoviense]